MGLLSKLLGPSRHSLQATVDAQKAAISSLVQAKYDAAQTTELNKNHWASADHYSADASLLPHVRRTLRNRARYEMRNNSYAAGIASTWANDLVGTGPRLQLDLGPDVSPDAVRAVETAVYDWSVNVDLARKLRIAKAAKITDGEVFALKTNNGRLRGVQLDVKLVEADQVMSPLGFMTENDVDGLRFDQDGNVSQYWVARHHPGSLTPGFILEGNWVDSDFVCHWFHATRPGQHRGVPEIAPALELFALLRRYTLAVVTAAETAANFAAIFKTTMPASGTASGIDLGETLPIVRGMAMAAPEGWEPVQMKAEHPTSTHDSFVRRMLNEIARSIDMPYIVAAMDSSSANYSSMRGDYLVYRKRIAVERNDMERVFLDPLLMSWLDEAVDVGGVIFRGLPPFAAWNWSWTWDGFEHVDPLKEANADAAMVAANMASLSEVCAKRGRDWRVVMRQRAAESALQQELGLNPPQQDAASNDPQEQEQA